MRRLPVTQADQSPSGPTPETRRPARSFTKLVVWQKAHLLTLATYRLTADFPREEIYGLTSQFRRAAVSIPANIAEGFRRRQIPDKLRFLNIAQGSLEEARYYMILAADLGYCRKDVLKPEIEEVSRLLQAYSEGAAANHAHRKADRT